MPQGLRVDRNIFKRNGIYYVRYTDANGVQRVRSTRTREKKNAYALLSKLETDAFERREFPGRTKSALTMQGLRDIAVRHLDEQRKSTDHVRHLDAAVDWFGANQRASALTFDSLADWRDSLKTKPNGKPRAVSTVNGYIVDLLTALNHAVDARLLERNPVHGFDLKKPRNERDRVATEDEFRTLCGIADPEMRLAIVIGYYTPMRLGEIAAVERPRVFLRDRFIAIGEGHTKNDEGRLVPLAQPVAEELAHFLKAHPERTGRLLQPHRATIRKAVNALSKSFSRLADEAGCHDLKFHDLKHTSLTNYRRSGMDFSQMQKISGNKTVDLLVKRYQKVVDDELLDAVDKAASRKTHNEKRKAKPRRRKPTSEDDDRSAAAKELDRAGGDLKQEREQATAVAEPAELHHLRVVRERVYERAGDRE